LIAGALWRERARDPPHVGRGPALPPQRKARAVSSEADVPAQPRPAASVIVVRAAEAGIVTYLVRRSDRSRFVPAAHVFPGGAVEAADREPRAAALVVGAPRAAPEFARAALRELFEEAGVLFFCDPRGEPVSLAHAALARMRGACADGTSLYAVLEREGLRLDARELFAYSHWLTPEREPIRFDVRFFLALAPDGQSAQTDGCEVDDGRWLAPAHALELAERGELELIYPTRRHLARLARFDSLEALFAHARARTFEAVMPVERAAGVYALAGGDEAW
ncbi:MAG: NUDIX hydrolase, partial [Candidatus Dormibacteria bacterium]